MLMSTNCGHVFCSSCLKAVMQQQQRKCPSCRKTLTERKIHPLYIWWLTNASNITPPTHTHVEISQKGRCQLPVYIQYTDQLRFIHPQQIISRIVYFSNLVLYFELQYIVNNVYWYLVSVTHTHTHLEHKGVYLSVFLGIYFCLRFSLPLYVSDINICQWH